MSDTKSVLVIDGNVVGDVFQNATEDYVEVTADGDTAYQTLLNNLYSQVDKNKLTESSTISLGEYTYQLSRKSTNNVEFVKLQYGTGTSYYTLVMILSNSSSYLRFENTTSSYPSVTALTNAKPANGTKITLYYGNKTSQVDLTTHANKCMMSDGETTVEGLFKTIEHTIPNDTDLHEYAYPTGFTKTNCILISAKIYTRYGSYVDVGYSDGNYWGELGYSSTNEFSYKAKVAGNASRIQFTFMKLVQ